MALDSPLRINNSSHEASDFLTGGTSKFVISASFPCCLGVIVDILNVLFEVNRHLSEEHFGDRFTSAEI